nr:MAG: hypothetical protein OI720_00240 [Candidatus Methanoperedens sp.]
METRYDPLPAKEGKAIWSPIRIELWCGDTISALHKGGKRMICPDRMKGFKAFQRMFPRNIREQGWLENGEKVEKVRNWCIQYELCICLKFFVSFSIYL